MVAKRKSGVQTSAVSKKLKESLQKEEETPIAVPEYESDDEELALEALVFGGTNRKSNKSKVLEKVQSENVHAEAADDDLFFIDTQTDAVEEVADEEADAAWSDAAEITVDLQATNRTKKLRKDYDETLVGGKDYEQRLRAQFEKINPTPAWATETPAVESNELLQSTKSMLSRTVKSLNPEKIDIVRVKDANQKSYSSSAIQSIGFHATAPVMLTSGLDKTLRLFQIDGKENPKLSSYRLNDMPIFKAHFNASGTEIILTGRRNFFYSLDLETGDMNRIRGIRGRDERSYEKSYVSPCDNYIVVLGLDGYIILVSMKTKQWVANLKMNTSVVSVAFTDNGHLWSLGTDGDVYQWDLSTKKCLHKFADEGCIKGVTIAVSSDSKWIAVGSSSGVVNIYDMKTALESTNPVPAKAIMNLTTSATTIVFHPSSDLIAIASKEIKDSLKLFHLPTMRIVKNWPTAETPLGYVHDVAFSHNGRFVGIGNNKGKVLLYRLEAFT